MFKKRHIKMSERHSNLSSILLTSFRYPLYFYVVLGF